MIKHDSAALNDRHLNLAMLKIESLTPDTQMHPSSQALRVCPTKLGLTQTAEKHSARIHGMPGSSQVTD